LASGFDGAYPNKVEQLNYLADRIEAALKPGGAAMRLYHKASEVNGKGQVSALCYDTPCPINLKRESWALVDKSVTCPDCLRLMRAKAEATPEQPSSKPRATGKMDKRAAKGEGT
jgi:hypothetical protein